MLTQTPRVSILLPNLNHHRFLEERLHTILQQTFTDWELIIVDSYSEDGAWELIQEFVSHDVRIRASQAPREGIYAGLNRCIQRARGEFVYIAMSDDTMSPECLATMVQALDNHPECDLCHTCLAVIDEHGQAIPGHWQKYALTAQYFGELLYTPHIRYAPHDGMLACMIGTVYTSLTQLLIRRRVFEKVGLFRTDWGSVGDHEWSMRASFVCHTMHIPKTLATWRVYADQATAQVDYDSAEFQAQNCAMVQAALPILRAHNPEFYRTLRVARLLFAYRQEQLLLGLYQAPTVLAKLWFALKFLRIRPDIVVGSVCRKLLTGNPRIDRFAYIRRELQRLGLNQSIQILEE